MFLPEIVENENTRSMITQWRGYNHNYSIGMGEFYDMENMTVDSFPIMTARDVRPTLLEALHGYRAILYTDGTLAWLDGNIFHFKSWELDLAPLYEGSLEVSWADQHNLFTDAPDAEVVLWEEETMIRFGTYILIFPKPTSHEPKIWVDIEKRTAGLIESHFVSATDVTITYSIATQEGGAYQNLVVQETAPANPSEGDYWLNNTEGYEGLNVYLQSSWQPVPTCYIKIAIENAGFDDYFSVGDIVNMNVSDSEIREYNNGSMIQAVTDDYFTIIGLMHEAQKTETTSAGYKLEVSRELPTMDFICADKNRLWGCRYGWDSEGMINEIYASKLGDFKNWNSYQGIATDSYAATIGIPGRFTGCISYGGYPTFFKENAIIRVSGNYPAEYNVMTMDARGVQEGSEKSLAIVGEALYYKAPGGVMVYDGSLPRMISHEFGRSDSYYYDGIAGVCGFKYYLELSNAQGAKRVFVYDSEYGLWTKENQIGPSPHYLLGFSGATDGRLFAFAFDKIYGMGLSDNELYTNKKPGEEFASWFVESGDIGIDIPEFKFVSKFTIRAFIPAMSEINVSIQYDGKHWEDVGTIRGYAETMTHVISFAPYRCDHFKFKLSGHGKVRLYSLVITYDYESDEYEYKN